MSEVVQPAHGLWQETHRATCHPPKVRLFTNIQYLSPCLSLPSFVHLIYIYIQYTCIHTFTISHIYQKLTTLQTRKNDLARRSKPSLARIHRLPNVPHVVRHPIQAPRRPHRPPQVLRDALRARDRRRGRQHLRRTRTHADGHGPCRRAVPSHVQV